ncbi:unnamed protein product [Citrullus colocynthis]|uniref:Uncharacterized protein n=1 Tax=Citrullus colocynthis TaxID=252529 RepID=A0ABP0Z145_9ROSI
MIHLLLSFAEKLDCEVQWQHLAELPSLNAGMAFRFTPIVAEAFSLASIIERLNNAVTIFSFKLGLPGFDVTRNGIALASAIIFSYPLLFLLVTGVHIQLILDDSLQVLQA